MVDVELGAAEAEADTGADVAVAPPPRPPTEPGEQDAAPAPAPDGGDEGTNASLTWRSTQWLWQRVAGPGEPGTFWRKCEDYRAVAHGDEAELEQLRAEVLKLNRDLDSLGTSLIHGGESLVDAGREWLARERTEL